MGHDEDTHVEELIALVADYAAARAAFAEAVRRLPGRIVILRQPSRAKMNPTRMSALEDKADIANPPAHVC
jgi:hypothetical protein